MAGLVRNGMNSLKSAGPARGKRRICICAAVDMITWRVTVRAQSEPHSRTGLVTFMFGFLGGLSPKYVEVTWDTEQVDD